MVTLALAPALPAGTAGAGVEWSNASTPGGGAVWGVGGSSEVLVASMMGFGGAFQSFDGGHRWESIPGFPVTESGSIVADPTNPLVVYVAGFGGVARTLDGGLTWQHVLDTSASYRAAVAPDGRVAASYRDADSNTFVYVSDDHGATWTNWGGNLPRFTSLYGMAFGRTSDELTAMTISRTYTTLDGGATWTETAAGGLDLARGPDGSMWRVGFSTLDRSTDGGATWATVPAPSVGDPVAVGPDGRIFMGSHDGILISEDDGASWTNVGYGDLTFAVTTAVVDPHDPAAVFMSDENLAVLHLGPTEDGAYALEGRTTGLPPVDIVTLGRSLDGSLLLAGGPLGAYASRDGGATWAHTGAGAGFIGVFGLGASADGGVVYVGGQNRVFQPFVESSRDGGRTFTWFGFDAGGDGRTVGIAVDPADGMHAYAAVWMELADSHVFETTDGGVTWMSVFKVPPKINDIAWDAASGGPVVATEVGIFGQDDATGLWLPRSVSAPGVRTVAADGGHVYAGGSGAQVWRDTAAGGPLAPWANTLVPLDLAADPVDGDSVWVAGTNGRIQRCVPSSDGILPTGACVDASLPEGGARSIMMTPDGGRVMAASGAGGIYQATL